MEYIFEPEVLRYPPRKVNLRRDDEIVATFYLNDLESFMRYRDVFTHLLGEVETSKLLNLGEPVELITDKPFNTFF